MELDGLLNRPLSEFERFNVMTPQGEQLREDLLGPPSYRSVMAINTDAAFEKTGLGEREVSNPTDFQDTEKLLSKAPAEPTGESNLKPSDSFPLNTRSSVRSLDAEQNGRRSPLKSGSIGQLTAPPRSTSRLSLGQLSSPVPPGSEPPSYLWLAVVSCFCPGVPFNVCALWYANVSRSVLHTGDIEGARKYGRRSMLLSILAMLTGVVVIIFIVLTIEAQQ
ncbi:PREDICTED: tumor suppressor candidate 5 homolog [Poecilia mexicana]|uniref:Trafficking regulator of GLUT4 (SLC2A4) 1b n=2 Tax=Poecilia formosa TaxID=48698 RepID=A0A096LYG3_POEFO|nr:PREDICTED: tumor suppressor candidate 5 homolog [Poecilia formosa]XP_007553784.1 PREDICTED: tumor suppressor candidate 5 homolog [Poecilia formosa]XP_014828002.1 PREDICTED: tumor suppressor candidate 5 homolog [Poecilia mexicana]XP_014832365.1 PREDICTED: tumor suppressor candidate 5 homolog [Poecilia mexicana]